MHLHIVEPSAIPGLWEWMRSLLSSSIAHDDERDEKDVFLALMDGSLRAFIIEGEIRGVVVTQQTGRWFWVIYASGEVDVPRYVNMQRLMRAFECVAEQLDCGQIHMIGRKGWARALRAIGYENFGEVRGHAHVRKVL